MVKVVITGGSGFIAQHLIKRLQENFLTNGIEEITTIDRKPFPKKYLKYPENIPIYHKHCELTNLGSVKAALKNKNVVFHLGRKRFEMLFDPEKEVENSEAYIRDNIEATETLIEAMISENVPYLVYLSDAYANLEIEENYGLSEDNFSGIPKTFLTGEYGETKIRGEIFARKSVGRKLKSGDQTLHAVFPRATLIYGEGDSKMIETFLNVCQRHQGCVPFFEGSSRGMFQYIYAGNLAGILECCMKTLMNEPKRCNGDYFYCMEDTKATKINEFYAPLLEAAGHSFISSGSYYYTFLSTFIHEFKERIFGGEKNLSSKKFGKEFSRAALRFLFAYGYGFSNRKQQLTMDYRTEFPPSAGLKRTAQWISANFGDQKMIIVEEKLSTKVDKLSEHRHDENVLRMG